MKLLLVGAGGFGRVVLEHVIEKYEVAFLDDGDVQNADGVPVIGKTSDMEKFFPEYRQLLVTIGNNPLREKLYRRAAEIGYTFPNLIVPSAYVSPNATLGAGIIVLNNAVIQNGAKTGDGTILNPGVEAHHDSTIGNYCLIYTNSVVRSLTHVGDRAWIGSTCTISTGAEVKADAVIEDGSVVRKE
jgi:sugar O-acyltransferase (sialic acid O-acetyltransferase NeuD family)